MSDVEDPGWKPALKGIPSALIPMYSLRRATRESNGLVALRTMWVTFLSGIVLIGIVVLALWPSLRQGGPDARVVAGIVVAIALVTHLAARLVPQISGHDDADVRASAQRRFLLRVALAESSALIGFVSFIITENPAVYFVGAVAAVAALLQVCPSSAWLEREQRQLRAAGSSVNLLAALLSGGLTR